MVNDSPWGGTLALAALRFHDQVVAEGDRVAAVFFQNDGIYNALPAANTDPGTPDLATAWMAAGKNSGARLLLCSAALERRCSRELQAHIPDAFQAAGLGTFIELAGSCDRLVTF